MTHFGAADDVDAQLDELSERLDRWARWRATASKRRSWRRSAPRSRRPAPDAAAYEQAAPAEQLYAGLERYWRKRAEGRRVGSKRQLSSSRMSQTLSCPALGGPGSGLGGLWRVVVLNDNYNTFDHVAETLARFIPG